MDAHKRRDFWSDREIRTMLAIVHENQSTKMKLLDGKTKRNKTIFEDISKELKEKDISKTHIQVRNKYKSLKSDFFKAKRNNNKSGAKRQTSEHFELLDEIFGNRPELEAEGLDVIEMDYEKFEIEAIEESEGPSESQAAEENISVNGLEENKMRSFKRTKKQSYQNVVKSFTKEWKESQRELLQNIKEHDQNMINQQKQNQEELMEKSMEAMEKILEKDRQETAKMLQSFLTAIQPTQQSFPYVFNEHQSTLMEPSFNATSVPVPKTSPKDINSEFNEF